MATKQQRKPLATSIYRLKCLLVRLLLVFSLAKALLTSKKDKESFLLADLLATRVLLSSVGSSVGVSVELSSTGEAVAGGRLFKW